MVKSDTTIELTGENGALLRLEGIEIFDDGSGASGRLTVKSGHFSCEEYPFYFENIEEFHESALRLPKDLMGKVRLGHMYEDDVIEFEMTGLGHVEVCGKLQDSEQELGFCFLSDQAGLSIMLSSIERLLQEAGDSR